MFYLDPPYLVKKSYSSGNFIENDFVSMAKILKIIQGEFVLSLNDYDSMREIFKDFDFLGVETLWISGTAKNTSKRSAISQ
ncbi:hypothetical protein [Bartonella sp. MM73XJBT]|uniref:hypothetical protein n=1 Tax=Bartonella sp. MM73XJBT TaxID=3019095 RepID=UPI00318403F5